MTGRFNLRIEKALIKATRLQAVNEEVRVSKVVSKALIKYLETNANLKKSKT